MQPLISLKQFLAVLLILIVPAALLTAYFRNYQPETGGSGHEHADAAGTHPAGGHGDMAKPPAEADSHEHGATSGDDHEKMKHEKKVDAAAPDAKQLEASRAQLEASRAQLEASRQALEASKAQPPTPPQSQPPAMKGKPAEPAAPAEPGKKPEVPKPGGAADGHAHKH